LAPEALRRAVCYVQQTPTLVPESVRTNLRLPFGFRLNADRTPPDDALLRRLNDFRLDAVELHHGAQTLSVGRKQRLCILRAVLLRPRLLLLDEPTAALDRDNARRLRDVIERLNRDEGVTVMMVSHNAANARSATARIRIAGECECLSETTSSSCSTVLRGENKKSKTTKSTKVDNSASRWLH